MAIATREIKHGHEIHHFFGLISMNTCIFIGVFQCHVWFSEGSCLSPESFEVEIWIQMLGDAVWSPLFWWSWFGLLGEQIRIKLRSILWWENTFEWVVGFHFFCDPCWYVILANLICWMTMHLLKMFAMKTTQFFLISVINNLSAAGL